MKLRLLHLPFVLLLAMHPDTRIVEHYMFQLDQGGGGTLVWGSLKGAGRPFPKSAIYESICRSP